VNGVICFRGQKLIAWIERPKERSVLLVQGRFMIRQRLARQKKRLTKEIHSTKEVLSTIEAGKTIERTENRMEFLSFFLSHRTLSVKHRGKVRMSDYFYQCPVLADAASISLYSGGAGKGALFVIFKREISTEGECMREHSGPDDWSEISLTLLVSSMDREAKQMRYL
jgi:hypothetical protein